MFSINSPQPVNFYVLIHGLHGAPSDLAFLRDRILEGVPKCACLLARGNTGKLMATHDGVDVGGRYIFFFGPLRPSNQESVCLTDGSHRKLLKQSVHTGLSSTLALSDTPSAVPAAVFFVPSVITLSFRCLQPFRDWRAVRPGRLPAPATRQLHDVCVTAPGIVAGAAKPPSTV